MEVLILERFSVEALAFLKSQPQLQITDNTSSAEALIIRSKTKVDQTLLNQYPNLKMIVTATSGYDHINLEETAKKNIRVFYTPLANAQSAAEMTWALLLAVARKIPKALESVKSSDWNREVLMGVELYEKTMGIIGLGRVGSRVAKMAQSFGMKLVGFDPYVKKDVFESLNVERLGMTELIRSCDVISLHVPYTKETHHMLNARSMEDVQNHCILINTSRGNVILEQEIIQMLQNKSLLAAGLDVFQKEPLPKDSPLLGLSNVVLTPHIGATTEEAFQKASFMAAQTVIDFFNGKMPENEIFPGRSYVFKN